MLSILMMPFENDRRAPAAVGQGELQPPGDDRGEHIAVVRQNAVAALRGGYDEREAFADVEGVIGRQYGKREAVHRLPAFLTTSSMVPTL